MYRRVGKRIVDLVLTIPAMLVLAPVMLLLAVGVWWQMGRPVLFRQVRPGRGGRPFELVKFRTMRDAVGADGRPLPDGERLTQFGRWLRATSLDELPELLNVLRGEMSLVGPRPLLMQYLDRYTPTQARRHQVRPGLTGWAQVNGRNQTSWPERLAQDVHYVDHVSLSLDARILWMTVRAVLGRRGVSQEGHATVEEFLGE
jgi:lipopolysaccharide/colanic/teichoic acid biosynthesis glycosyltransferase